MKTIRIKGKGKLECPSWLKAEEGRVYVESELYALGAKLDRYNFVKIKAVDAKVTKKYYQPKEEKAED